MVLSLTAIAEQALRENVLVLEKKPPHRGEMGKIRQKKMMGGKKRIGQRRYRPETNLLYPLLHQRGNNPT